MFGTKSFPGVGYPTPVSIPSALSCRQVSVPSSTEWEALLMGLMLTLSDEKSWQQFPGGISAADAAAEWADVIERMYASAESLGAACGVQLPYEYRVVAGVVETSPDHGTTWTPNPYADPRNQRYYPAVSTADPCCDASARVVAFMHEWVDGTVAALTAGADFFALAGILGELIAPFMGEWYVIFDLFVSLAGGLVSAGASSIGTAFTNAVYDDIECYLYCACGGGEWTDLGRGKVEQEITDNQGTVVALVANGLLELTGTAGLNNLAGGRTETGSCGGCPGCGWCYTIDFTASNGGFSQWNGVSPLAGTWVAGSGWQTQDTHPNTWYRTLWITRSLPAGTYTEVDWTILVSNWGSSNKLDQIRIPATTVRGGDTTNVGVVTSSWVGNLVNPGSIVVGVGPDGNKSTQAALSGSTILKSITFRGTGTNPFGSNNC